MRLKLRQNILALCVPFCLLLLRICFAAEFQPFLGKINANNINIRSDSRVSSQIITTLSQNDTVEVISESYSWYKIELPQNAPAYIKKNMTECINYSNDHQCQSAKVVKERVNVRLDPNETAAILGKVNQNEVIGITKEEGQWYRVKPPKNTFGWVYKNFVNKIDTPKLALKPQTDNKAEAPATLTAEENVTLEGVIKPYGKIIRRIATHRLITQENQTFLLKGDKKSLDALNNHKVRVQGKKIEAPKQKYPLIEVKILEALN